MKTSAAIVLLAAAQAAAFTGPATSRTTPSSTSLNSFLEGRGAKITIREDEDNAMWFGDEYTKKEEPKAAGKKPAAKKGAPKAEAPKKTGGFKFPWDK